MVNGELPWWDFNPLVIMRFVAHRRTRRARREMPTNYAEYHELKQAIRSIFVESFLLDKIITKVDAKNQDKCDKKPNKIPDKIN